MRDEPSATCRQNVAGAGHGEDEGGRLRWWPRLTRIAGAFHHWRCRARKATCRTKGTVAPLELRRASMAPRRMIRDAKLQSADQYLCTARDIHRPSVPRKVQDGWRDSRRKSPRNRASLGSPRAPSKRWPFCSREPLQSGPFGDHLKNGGGS